MQKFITSNNKLGTILESESEDSFNLEVQAFVEANDNESKTPS
jgi:hypothetical protein